MRFSPTATGSFTANVSFASNGGNASQVVTGTGAAAPAISVTPTTLAFGSVAVGSSADLTFAVDNSGGGTLSGTCSTNAPFSLPNGCSFNLTSGQTAVVTVRFSPTATGAFTGNVSFTSNGGDVSSAVTGTGTVKPPLTISSISPTSGLAGTVVTIKGRKFGANQGSSFVRFGSAQAAINSWSDTQIVAAAPSGPVGSVPVTVTTLVGTSNSNKAFAYVIDAQTLVQSLMKLKETISGKLDADVGTIVTAFGDAKDINTSLFWADWAKPFLVVIEGTIKAISDILSLFGTSLAEFQVKATQGISEAEGFVKTFSWIQTLQGVWDSGTQLQLAIDGPAYTSSIENMVGTAERVACGVVGCAIKFDKAKYEKVIRNHIQAPGIIVVPHRTSDVQRRKFEVAQGVNQAKVRISRRLQSAINALSRNPLIPSNFPLEETVRRLEALAIKMTESKSRGVAFAYEALLPDGESIVDYMQSVTLGRIGALEQNRAVALGLFDENAFLEQIITVNAAQDAIIKASVLQMESVYKKFGEPGVPPIELPLFKTHSLLTTGIKVSISSLQKQDGINARDLINQVPQNMVMALPDELSDLWMVADDVVNTINAKLGR